MQGLLIYIAGVITGISIFIIYKLNKMSKVIDDLTAAVAAENTVIGSVETLLVTLNQELATEIQALADAGVDTTALQAITDGITAKTAELAAAVTANTPEAPAP